MDYELQKCKICSRKFRIDIIKELRETRIPFIFHINYEEKNKFKPKGNNSFGRHSKSSFICIDCALQVNESLMKYFNNKRLELWRFEREKGEDKE